MKSVGKKFIARQDSTSIIATIVLVLVFWTLQPEFLSAFNIFNVSRTAALYAFVALGQAMAIVVGDMNVALGAMGSLSVVMLGVCMETWGLPPIMAVVITLTVGVLAGLFNGIIIAKFKMNPFVVTLATSFVFTGLANGISKGQPYSNIPDTFTLLGKGKILGISNLVWLLFVVLAIVALFFRFTKLGRSILATGGSEPASRLSGIKTSKIKLIANCLSGFFAAAAACLWVSRVGTAQPSTGTDWMMTSMAVTVIGGTSMSGGVISPLGFAFAGLLMALIRNGLIMIGVNVYYEQAFLGAVILAALLIDYFRMRVITRGR